MKRTSAVEGRREKPRSLSPALPSVSLQPPPGAGAGEAGRREAAVLPCGSFDRVWLGLRAAAAAAAFSPAAPSAPRSPPLSSSPLLGKLFIHLKYRVT